MHYNGLSYYAYVSQWLNVSTGIFSMAFLSILVATLQNLYYKLQGLALYCNLQRNADESIARQVAK